MNITVRVRIRNFIVSAGPHKVSMKGIYITGYFGSFGSDSSVTLFEREWLADSGSFLTSSFFMMVQEDLKFLLPLEEEFQIRRNEDWHWEGQRTLTVPLHTVRGC